MSTIDPIVIQIGLNVQQARQAATQMGQVAQTAASRIRDEVAKGERAAQQQTLAVTKNLFDKRRQIAVQAIGDETERAVAGIKLRYDLELESIKRLLRARRESGEITAKQFEAQLRDFQQGLAAVRDRNVGAATEKGAKGIDRVGQASQRANLFLVDFGRTINDLPFGIIGIANNLDPLILGYQRLKVEAKELTAETGKQVGVSKLLFNQLKGPAGLAVGLNVVASSAIVLGPVLAKLFSEGAEEAKKLKEQVREVLDDLLTINQTKISFNLDADQARDVLKAFEADLADTNRRLREDDLAQQRNRPGSGGLAGNVGADIAAAVAEEEGRTLVALSEDQRRQTELQKEEQQAIVAELKEQVKLAERYASFTNTLQAGGLVGETEEQQRAREEAEREAERLRKKAIADRERLAEQVNGIVAQADIDRIADAQARELAALDRTYQETIANANRVGAETAGIEEVYQRQRTEIQARYVAEVIEKRVQLEDAQAALIERRAELEGQTEQATLQARIDRTRQLLAIEQLSAEQRLELEERLEGEVLDLDEARLRSAQRVAELRADADALGGRRTLAALRARHDAELDAVENAAERQRVEAVQQFEQRTVEIEQARQQEAERLRASIEGELELRQALYNNDLAAKLDVEEAKREAERQTTEIARQENERRIAEVERYAARALTIVADEARGRGRISEADARLTELGFQEREENLEESLERRQISQERFDAEIAALAEQRNAFEEQREADKAGFVERTTNSLISALIEEGQRYLIALAARAVAEFLIGSGSIAAMTAATTGAMATITASAVSAATLTSIATGGGAAVTGAAAVVAALSSVKGAAAIAGAFATGGQVSGPGTGTSDSILALLSNGEHVITAAGARGQHRELIHLNRLMERGLDLRSVLSAASTPRFALGGPALIAPPRFDSSFTRGGFDDSRLIASQEMIAFKQRQDAERLAARQGSSPVVFDRRAQVRANDARKAEQRRISTSFRTTKRRSR